MFKVCFFVFFYQLVSFHLLLFQRNPTELDDAFAKIAEFMAQTTSHCKVSDYVPKHLYVDFQLQTWENKIWILSLLQRFYKSGCCTQPSDIEKNHMSRFHTQPASAKTSAALPTRKCDKYQVILRCVFDYLE